MSFDRRTFLKGLAAAAVAVAIPLKTLEAIVNVCSKNDLEIFYVKPELYMRYEEVLPSKYKFVRHSLLEEGIEHICYKGYPVVPFEGEIDKSVKFGPPDLIVKKPYKKMHDSFVKVIESYEKKIKD